MKNTKIVAAALTTLLGSLSVQAADPVSPPTPPAATPEISALVESLSHLSGKTEKGAFLGVSTSRAPIALLKQLKIKSGLLIESVVPNSPAEKAGLKATDILERMGDQILVNPAQLEGLIRMNKAGDNVTLSLIHEGDRNTATAQLAEHDVLAMTDTDPQELAGALMKDLNVSVGSPRVRVMTSKSGDGSDVFATPASNGSFQVMTMVDKSDLSPDGKKSNSFESQFSNGKFQLTIVRNDSGRVLTIKDMDGKQLFEGPVDTDAQQKAIPKDLQSEFREMQKLQTITSSTTQP